MLRHLIIYCVCVCAYMRACVCVCVHACECTSLTKGLAATEEDRETLVTPLSWREPISPASLEVLYCPCLQQQQEKTESMTCQQVCSYSLAQLDITT